MYDDHDYGAQTERHLCTIVLFLYFMIELGRKPFCILPSIYSKYHFRTLEFTD